MRGRRSSPTPTSSRTDGDAPALARAPELRRCGVRHPGRAAAHAPGVGLGGDRARARGARVLALGAIVAGSRRATRALGVAAPAAHGALARGGAVPGVAGTEAGVRAGGLGAGGRPDHAAGVHAGAAPGDARSHALPAHARLARGALGGARVDGGAAALAPVAGSVRAGADGGAG